MTPQVYHYERGTFEYLGHSDLKLDVIDDTPSPPANATVIEPPTFTKGNIPVFNEEDDTWSIVEDHRNAIVFSENDGSGLLMEELGPLPTGYVKTRPVEFVLADAKSEKIRQLVLSFNVDLNSGFESSALGTSHSYDSEPHNRENIIGAVASGVSQKFTCDDLKGNATSKKQRIHDTAQLQKVLQDGATVKQTLIVKFRGLRNDVNATADEAAVDAIAW